MAWAVLSCALTPLCWIAPILLGSSAVGPDHLGSSCILALSSVNNLQDDHLSAVKLCLCFLLARGVFGKQGYQCQGKVLLPCVVCVGCAVPGVLSHAAGTSCSSQPLWRHHHLPRQPLLLSPCQVCVAAGAATFLPTPGCPVAVSSCAGPLSCWLHAAPS